MTQRERMKAGMIFNDLDEGLPEERLRGKELIYDYNQTRPSEEKRRVELAKKIFGKIGDKFYLEPPIHFAYGSNIYIGENFYSNFNLTILDDNIVTIGDNVLIAPNVTISVTGHPVHHELRPQGEMFTFPVVIEDNVWIGSGVIINPGVTIGKNSVIGAGSVVTKNIPSDVIAVGSPCKILREINDNDKIYYYKNRKVE